MTDSESDAPEPSRRTQLIESPDPPFMGIVPPKNLRAIIKDAVSRHDLKAVSWGFPLCTAWVKSRWQEVRKYTPEIHEAETVASAVNYMKLDCASVWPEGRSEWMIVDVDPKTNGQYWCYFLGFDCRPPPDVVEALTEVMEMYGVYELPYFYPRRG